MARVLVLGLVGCLCVAVGLMWGVKMMRDQIFPYNLLRGLAASMEGDIPPEAIVGYRERVGVFTRFGRMADVVMLGDSQTALCEWSEAMPGVAVVNRGIGGDTVEGVRRRVASVLQLSPRVVVLMIGINDIIRGRTAEDVAADYRALVDALLAPPPAGAAKAAPRLVLVSTLPVATSYRVSLRGVSETNRRVAALNVEIAKLAAERRQTFLDLAKELTPGGMLPDALTTDGLHLNTTAYEGWITRLMPLIKAQ